MAGQMCEENTTIFNKDIVHHLWSLLNDCWSLVGDIHLDFFLTEYKMDVTPIQWGKWIIAQQKYEMIQAKDLQNYLTICFNLAQYAQCLSNQVKRSIKELVCHNCKNHKDTFINILKQLEMYVYFKLIKTEGRKCCQLNLLYTCERYKDVLNNIRMFCIANDRLQNGTLEGACLKCIFTHVNCTKHNIIKLKYTDKSVGLPPLLFDKLLLFVTDIKLNDDFDAMLTALKIRCEDHDNDSMSDCKFYN